MPGSRRVRYMGTVQTAAGQSCPVYAAVEPHVCNPYCRDGGHAELLYREEDGPPTLTFVQAVATLVSPGRPVLDVRPAPEAPLPPGFRGAWLVIYGPVPAPGGVADTEAQRWW